MRPIGLDNVGNTCFINASVQLVWLALASWLLRGGPPAEGLTMMPRRAVKEAESTMTAASKKEKRQQKKADEEAFKRAEADISADVVSSADDVTWIDGKLQEILIKVADTDKSIFAILNTIFVGGQQLSPNPKTAARFTNPHMRRLKEVLAASNERFMDWDQHDAHELLQCLLSVLHAETNAGRGDNAAYKAIKDRHSSESVADASRRWLALAEARDNSIVTDMFRFMVQTTTKCSSCKRASYNFDTWNELQVHLWMDSPPPAPEASDDDNIRSETQTESEDDEVAETEAVPESSPVIVPEQVTTQVAKPSSKPVKKNKKVSKKEKKELRQQEREAKRQSKKNSCKPPEKEKERRPKRKTRNDEPVSDDAVDLCALVAQRYRTVEVVDGWRCDHCKAETSCTKETVMLSAPHFLLLHLLRFTPDGRKRKTPVCFPAPDGGASALVSLPTLPLLHCPNGSSTSSYRVAGTISHQGASLNSGHYTSAVRDMRGPQWYGCDDEAISEPMPASASLSATGDRNVYIILLEAIPVAAEDRRH